MTMIIETVESVLQMWAFEEYIEIFKANNIDFETLLLLSFDTLAPLMPIVGDRLRFLTKLEELKTSKPVEEITEGIFEEPISPAESVHSAENVSVIEPNALIPEAENRCSVGSKRTTASNKTVEHYLQCTKGETIRSNYLGPKNNRKVKPFLDVTAQNSLSDLIIQNELSDPNITISPHRFVDLAKQIKAIFPNEVEGTYFIPYSSIKVGGKVVRKSPAQGKLYHRYNNYCKILLANGVRTYKKKCSNTSDQSATEEDVPADNIATTLRWLESQLQITTKLKTKWKETSRYRLNELQRGNAKCITFIKQSGKCFVNSYLVKYPFLRQPDGYTLLEQDFIEKYPEKEYTLFENWNNFKIKVKEISGKNEELNEARVLLEFCSIVTAKQPTKRVTKKWVANSEEISEGFLLHIKVIDSLDAETDRIVQRALDNKIHVSPFAVIVGVDVEQIIASYVYIDGVQFKVGSVLQAIDITFKSVHALHAEYQVQSQSIWLLFQKVMYNLTTEWDHKSSVVEELLPMFQ